MLKNVAFLFKYFMSTGLSVIIQDARFLNDHRVINALSSKALLECIICKYIIQHDLPNIYLRITVLCLFLQSEVF